MMPSSLFLLAPTLTLPRGGRGQIRNGHDVDTPPPPDGGRLGGNAVVLTPPPIGGRLGGGQPK